MVRQSSPAWFVAALLLGGSSAAAAEEKLPKPLIEGLKRPAAIAVAGGRVFVTLRGEDGKDGTGTVVVLQDGKAVPFAAGLDDPRGLVAFQGSLYVADRARVWRIDAKGKAVVFAAADAFPKKPAALTDITADEQGTLYVCDVGIEKGKGCRVYRIDPKGKVSLVTDEVQSPTALTMDGMSFLLVLNANSGVLHRVKVADGSAAEVADGFGGGAGLAWDLFGRLFVSDGKNGKVSVIPRPGEKPVLTASGFRTPAGLRLGPDGKRVLVTDTEAGTVTALPAVVPGQEVDESPLPVEVVVAFPDLQWTGWKPENDKGQLVPLRPIVLTHAGDGSNRVFVATEHGVIHVFPNDQKAAKTEVFLDIQDRVVYDDKQNEEDFLGLAFHPKFKDNGEFFVFYTLKKAKLTNVVSRFRVMKDNPNKADPASEEVLLRIEKPFWNHDGGTICFGPDGFLYVTHGDGGSANDPFNNGQSLKTLLGKVLRIDVDRKNPGKNYAVPKDNPFADRKDALPEIWAYGLRNVWRMSFDRKTGKLWAGDVGQNLYEEIDIITKGGNYGWNLREGLHPFGAAGVGPRPDLVEPVWEYHHDLGKCIVGGHVYRGSRLPELEGMYLYGDYVNNWLRALRYDGDRRRVVANRPVRDKNFPMLSFGEDEKGEVYVLTATPSGKGIYWFVRSAEGPKR